jgi:hypothetical protein
MRPYRAPQQIAGETSGLEAGGVLVVPPAPVLLLLLLAALGKLSVAVVLLCLILVRAIAIPVSVTIPMPRADDTASACQRDRHHCQHQEPTQVMPYALHRSCLRP